MINSQFFIISFSLGLLMSVSANSAFSQKYLQFENRSGKVIERFQAGDQITFKKENDPFTHSGSIMRMDVEQRIVYLEGWVIPIDSISEIQRAKVRNTRIAGNFLRIAGAVGFVNSVLAGLLFRAQNAKQFTIITGSTAAAGQILYMAGKNKKWCRKAAGFKLRMIDLQFY